MSRADVSLAKVLGKGQGLLGSNEIVAQMPFGKAYGD